MIRVLLLDSIGDELDAFIQENGPFDRVIYVGDGGNDFCPILRMRQFVSPLPSVHRVCLFDERR